MKIVPFPILASFPLQIVFQHRLRKLNVCYINSPTSLSYFSHDENPQIQKSTVSEKLANTKLHQVSHKCRSEETNTEIEQKENIAGVAFSFQHNVIHSHMPCTPSNLLPVLGNCHLRSHFRLFLGLGFASIPVLAVPGMIDLGSLLPEFAKSLHLFCLGSALLRY